ncbi:MAG TPA: GFA family protein [Gammaproteobacteria bacterium]|nr:GFA family protein [Gammaproteobacteria bacterium]
MSNLKGCCLCGEISYQVTSEILNVVNCHCNFCRSHSGAAFSTYAVIPFPSLAIIHGEEYLSSHEIEEGKKHFCKKCGTPVFNQNKKFPGLLMIYHGTLENRNEITPMINLWCENQLEWINRISGIPSLNKGIEEKNA